MLVLVIQQVVWVFDNQLVLAYIYIHKKKTHSLKRGAGLTQPPIH